MNDFLTLLIPKLTLMLIQFPIYVMSLLICVKLHRNGLPTLGDRIYFYGVLISIVFMKTSSILDEWLGFGSGKNFTDWQNTVLCGFWAGGLSVFLAQIFIWIEVAVRKQTDH